MDKQGGIDGYNVTGPNGNSIFLPAMGYRNGSSFNYAGELGFYWSSMPNPSNTSNAYNLQFDSGNHNVNNNNRNNGYTVRAVAELTK